MLRNSNFCEIFNSANDNCCNFREIINHCLTITILIVLQYSVALQQSAHLLHQNNSIIRYQKFLLRIRNNQNQILNQNIYSRVFRISISIYQFIYQSSSIEIMTMTINIEKTCKKFDVITNTLKVRMIEQQTIARKNYHRYFDIFMSNINIFVKYSEENVMHKKNIIIYRDVNRFIDNFKIKRNENFQFKTKFVARYCFQNWIANWFFDFMKKLQNQITWNFDTFCIRLCQKYEQKWRKKQL